MGRIEAEVGVSVRTLHRYIPTKADIVWCPIDTSFQDLHERLRQIDTETGILEALATTLVDGFEEGREDTETTRARLRLIAATPELHARNSEPFEHWRRQIAQFLAHRLGAGEATWCR